ncbi:MAG: hypothetical protein UV98_C0004G0010 [Parcubacteria group bacterium GW2011_GWB1_43_6]|nr:MAG: hypothetical protein UV98_C0004G0010 [Parcubacteria group bacterium GW2011_GWB1_43_6]
MKLFELLMGLFSAKDLDFIINSAQEAINKKVSHAEKTKRFWDNQVRSRQLKNLVSPAAPSAGDIAIYQKYIKKIGPARSVIILGSTPKIRSLLNALGIRRYIVADFSFLMIEDNLLFRKAIDIDIDNEIWIKAEWNELCAKINPVDCFAGDLVFSQIYSNNQLNFLEKLSATLNPGGVFITRNHIMNKNLISQDPELIISETLKELAGDNLTTLVTTLFYRLRDRMRNNSKQITAPLELVKIFTKYKPTGEYERNVLRVALREALKRSRNDLDFITQTQDELESNLTKFFHIESVDFADDYKDAKYFPIYLLKKRDE